MKTQKIVRLLLLVVLAGGVALIGCAPSKQARSVDMEDAGILGDYSMLSKGTGDQALRTYRNKNADWSKYTKVIVDPVKFQRPENASQDELADLQKLVNNMEIFLRRELGYDYQIVSTPGPGTLKVRAAIFDAKKKRMVGNVLSSIVPIGIGLSVIKDVALGKPLAVGEISGEMKIADSETNELLAAAIDRRVGQKYSGSAFDSWAEANNAMEYWAKRLRFALCGVRGGSNCVEP